MHGEMLIGGHFIGGPCDQSTGKAVQRSPYDGQIIGTAAEGSYLELRAAVEAADDAFPGWAQTPIVERQALLLKIAHEVAFRSEDLAQLLVAEIGKPITLARAEVTRLRSTFLIAAEALNDWDSRAQDLGPDPRAESFRCEVSRVPRGVAFGIAPYNWPYNLAAHKIAPALATGNTFVLKPSPQALLSSYELGRVIHEAGCPPGVFNVVEAPPRDVSKCLEDPRIKLISFTGSEKVGWGIKGSLLPQTHCVLELGGDASAIVMPDSDLDHAIPKLVFGSFAYAGQICISIQHIWVHALVWEEFVPRFLQAAGGCPFGDPSLAETICGPLISSAAADRVEALVADSVAKGATAYSAGRVGNLIPPTVLVGVSDGARVTTEEVFGPVVLLHRFEDLGSLISVINQSRFGIQAGIFTHDEASVKLAFRDLEVGGLVVNDTPTVRFDAYPYGGVKQSGFGREGVREAMLAYTEPKTLLTSLPKEP